MSTCTRYHELDYGVIGILTFLLVMIYGVYKWDKQKFEGLFYLAMTLVGLWWAGVAVNKLINL